jgi:hypothetical protein
MGLAVNRQISEHGSCPAAESREIRSLVDDFSPLGIDVAHPQVAS